MIICITAFIFDTLLGDPQTRFHPVALIGRVISFWEGLLYKQNGSPREQLVRGLLTVLAVLITVAMAIVIIMFLLGYFRNTYLTILIEGLLLSFTICPRSLSQAACEIRRCLQKHDLINARQKVGWIVGRDTENLDESEIVRATVETVAENTTDGIVSPLFFYALGGLPLAVLYRTVNTMDSMLGYKNERYLYFGRAAARLDDVCNYLPARITGGLFILASWLLHFDFRNAWRMMRRDARKHPSPNGGFAEASVAGSLNIRLGGYNSYFGKKTFRAYMGEPVQQLQSRHIGEAVQLMYAVTVMAVFLASICWLGR